MSHPILPADLWADVLSVRSVRPLVHSITNLVVMNFNANVLLAMGASPVMAHAHEEVADMASIAQALVLNIGTLEPYWIESMRKALEIASKKGIKTVLDPVGAGATSYRNDSIKVLLKQAMPSVIRGNASEIMSVAGSAAQTRGVDSSAAVGDALQCARALALQTGGVVCVSGPVDHVFDADGRHASLSNGHEWMTRITGVGCSASALVGAFCAVQPDAWRATLSAMAYLGVVGEVAAQAVQQRNQGVGSLQIALLDQLQLLDQASFERQLRMAVSS
ncbi:MAG TPA: hydroxyethylthiazole kinase [Rhodoferax sp.]|nr:hydroxyethylthiazole kinase [Rhodoferax sp.]